MQDKPAAGENLFPGIPRIESPLFDTLFDPQTTDPEVYRVARALHEDGFAVIDFPDPGFSAKADRLIDTLRPEFQFDNWKAAKRAGHKGGMRVQDCWNTNPIVRDFATNPRILDLLEQLYGRRPFPFQTLNFPVGTEQHFHTDAVHFSCCPERFMCGVWIALEDIDESAGPLVYYPGSHKLPIFKNEEFGHCVKRGVRAQQNIYEQGWRALVEAVGLKPKRFLPRKGQALIWAANLLHGGDEHSDPERTRWSQVTHYYFRDCIYYTPMESSPFLGNVAVRTVIDIGTGRVVPNSLCGRKLPLPLQEFFRTGSPVNLELFRQYLRQFEFVNTLRKR